MSNSRWPPAGLLGFVGSLLLVPGAVVAADWLASLALAIGSIALFAGWWLLRPERGHSPYRLILALWALPLLVIPPVASKDVYAYAAQGWLVAHGLDPYSIVMGQAGPLGPLVDHYWSNTTAVYPPFMLHLQSLVVQLFANDPYWSAVGMRLLALVGVAGIVALVPLIARDLGVDPSRALWLIVLNPVTVMHFIGGAHNDSLMVAGILAAVWLARRPGGLLWSMIALGVAASCKQSAVVVGPAIAWYALHRRQLSRRDLVIAPLAGAVIGAVVFTGITWLTGLGWGWLNPSAGSPSQVISFAPLSWIRGGAIFFGHVPANVIDPILSVISLLAMAALFGWASWRWASTNPLRVALATMAAFVVAGTAAHAWYFVWIVALFPWGRWSERIWRWTVVAVLIITVAGATQAHWPLALALLVGGLAGLVGVRLARSGISENGTP